jgi:hypothetical protein
MADGADVENRAKRLFILNWTVVSGNGRYPHAGLRGAVYIATWPFRAVEMRLQRFTPATTRVSRIQVSTIFVATIRL